ncbi:hypothetical protein PHOSAC3_390002 [Mesotoga infera]|nr:hypothetical protein PHOSAC3_390002 [Mesotoga infera]
MLGIGSAMDIPPVPSHLRKYFGTFLTGKSKENVRNEEKLKLARHCKCCIEN